VTELSSATARMLVEVVAGSVVTKGMAEEAAPVGIVVSAALVVLSGEE